MLTEICECLRCPTLLQIVLGPIDAETPVEFMPHDDVQISGAQRAHGNISFTFGQINDSARGDQFNIQARVAFSHETGKWQQKMRWFYERGGVKPSRTVHNLAANLKAIARHWLKVDDATLTAMTRIVSKLAPPEQGMSDKNRARLRPFDSEDNMKAIVNLPQTIRRHLETSKNANMRKTGLSTAAMAIELLLVAPIRLSNLCQLHLDDNFIKVGDKVHLFIPKEDVKNRQDLEFELLPETVALLDWYKANHRKADPQNRYLFAGEGLTHKGLNTLRTQIMETVKAFTGLDVNPHLFRHIACSIYLSKNPGAYEIVRQVLGHRNISTTTNFYAGQEERRARQHFIGTIQKIREKPIAATKARGGES